MGERLLGVGTLGLCRIGLVRYGGVFGFIDGFYKSVCWDKDEERLGLCRRGLLVRVVASLRVERTLEAWLGGHVLVVLWLVGTGQRLQAVVGVGVGRCVLAGRVGEEQERGDKQRAGVYWQGKEWVGLGGVRVWECGVVLWAW